MMDETFSWVAADKIAASLGIQALPGAGHPIYDFREQHGNCSACILFEENGETGYVHDIGGQYDARSADADTWRHFRAEGLDQRKCGAISTNELKLLIGGQDG